MSHYTTSTGFSGSEDKYKLHLAKKEIADLRAEIARLKAIIREVEWVWDSEGYNPLTDTEMPESYECTFCHAKSPEDNHAESCPFYKWEGDD